MPEKLTLTRYLQGRGEVKALTHIEALAFGVPYPLQPGWPAKYGPMVITESMIDDLKARILTAKASTASKARRGLEGIGQVVVTKSAPLRHTERSTRSVTPGAIESEVPPAKVPMFSGFVLRPPRRYRTRKPAP